MTTPEHNYEPHLVIRDVALAPGAEWESASLNWTIVQLSSGTGYLLHRQGHRELEPGSLLLLGRSAAVLRASQLGGATLCYCHIHPERLLGIMTLQERDFLDAAAVRDSFSAQVLPHDSPAAAKMKELASQIRTGPLFRLQLLQVFFDFFGNELNLPNPESEQTFDARERLREFLKQTPGSEFLYLSFQDLVRTTRCTPRHLSRIFQEVVGMSFRQKRAELRLSRARELLATTESKVVHVALESGYQSLSLFNLMFARRFGTSPAKWRRKYQQPKTKTPPASRPLSPPRNPAIPVNRQTLGR